MNDLPFDPARADATVRLGETEIWRFSTDLHHPVHVHLSPFQVISRKGAAPGRYLLHCHNLEHEDMAMMAAFHTVG